MWRPLLISLAITTPLALVAGLIVMFARPQKALDLAFGGPLVMALGISLLIAWKIAEARQAAIAAAVFESSLRGGPPVAVVNRKGDVLMRGDQLSPPNQGDDDAQP
jgi:hypothetical protein